MPFFTCGRRSSKRENIRNPFYKGRLHRLESNRALGTADYENRSIGSVVTVVSRPDLRGEGSAARNIHPHVSKNLRKVIEDKNLDTVFSIALASLRYFLCL